MRMLYEYSDGEGWGGEGKGRESKDNGERKISGKEKGIRKEGRTI